MIFFKERLFWWVLWWQNGKPYGPAAGRPFRRDEESPSQESEAGVDWRDSGGGGQGFQHVLPSTWLVRAAHLSSSVV